MKLAGLIPGIYSSNFLTEHRSGLLKDGAARSGLDPPDIPNLMEATLPLRVPLHICIKFTMRISHSLEGTLASLKILVASVRL